MISGISRHIAKTAEFNIRKPEKFVDYTCAIFSGFAYTTEGLSFALNKKLPKEERRFLFFQELAEGAVGISLFLLLSSKFKKIGEKLVDKALILPDTLPNKFRTPEMVKRILTQDDKYTRILNEFKKNMGLAASLTGIIVVFNIITPIIRNKIASYFQQKKLQKESSNPFENSKIMEDFYKEHSVQEIRIETV